jgi:hypothetical protein
MCAEATTDGALRMRWQYPNGELTLDVDFDGGRADVADGGERTQVASWRP